MKFYNLKVDYLHYENNKLECGFSNKECKIFCFDEYPKEMLIEKNQNNYIKNKESFDEYNKGNVQDEYYEIEEDKEMIKLEKKEPVGLINIGGICYLNAVLQCFYYCKPLTKYFLNIGNNNKLGPISEGYYELVKGLSQGDSYAANKFKKAMMEFDETFIGIDGKDSKDVAIFLLSEIQDELKGNGNFIFKENNLNHSNLNQLYEQKILNENKNKTIITDTFNFLIKNEQKCKNTCKKFYNKYYNLESENIIIFDCEKIYKDIHKNNKNKAKNISLKDCLNHYKLEEIINCPLCKTNTLKIRKAILTLPKILIFVFNRGYNITFDCKITFEKDLDMKSYYEPIKRNNSDYNTLYSLIGATFVFDWTKGKKHTGHTVSFCRTYKKINNNPQYYIFNDNQPRKSNINEINGKVPYLLFYEKRI